MAEVGPMQMVGRTNKTGTVFWERGFSSRLGPELG